MIRKNVEFAIRLMQKATNLDMRQFRSPHGRQCDTVEEIHACGSKACFAGYLSATDEFYKAVCPPDCSMDFHGCVDMGDREKEPEETVAEFLGVSKELGLAIIYDHPYKGRSVYGCNSFKDVLPEHVIAVLNQILTGELT